MEHRVKCPVRAYKVTTRSILQVFLMYPIGSNKLTFFGPDALIPPHLYHHKNHQILFIYLILLCDSNHDKLDINVYPIFRTYLLCYIIGAVVYITLNNALSCSKIY